jgi:hypothetical protein
LRRRRIMAKDPYKDLHAPVRQDVLMNLCRAKLTKVDYYRFLMILFKETFGKKNMKMYTGKHRGKYMPWEPSTWVENGFDKSILARIKKELLSLKIIRVFYKTNIGFNWHFDQWKVEWRVDPAVNSRLSSQQESRLSSQQELTQQSTGVDSAVNTTSPRPVTDTDLQTGKKEERRSKEGEQKKDGAKAPNGVSVSEEGKDPIYDGYCTLFNKYFLKRDKKGENFKGTLHEYRKLVDGEEVTVDEVYASLVKFKKDQERRRVDYEYYPFLKNWLKGESWVNERVPEGAVKIAGEWVTKEEMAADDLIFEDWLRMKDREDLDFPGGTEVYKKWKQIKRAFRSNYYLLDKRRQHEQA